MTGLHYIKKGTIENLISFWQSRYAHTIFGTIPLSTLLVPMLWTAI